jgi:hypothetical protein
LIRPIASTVFGHLEVPEGRLRRRTHDAIGQADLEPALVERPRGEGSLILLSAGRHPSARIAALSQNVKCVTEDLVARGRACDGACA